MRYLNKLLQNPETPKRAFIIFLMLGVLYGGWTVVYDYWILGSDARKGDFYYKNAVTAIDKSDYESALTNLYDAENSYQLSRDLYGATDVEILKALSYAKKNDAVMSSYIMQKARNDIKKLNDPELMTYFYEKMLDLAVKYHQYSSIANLSSQNTDFLLANNKPKRAANSLVLLGDKISENDTPLTMELYSRALFLYEKQNDNYNQAQCHERIADIIATKDTNAAIFSYNRAKKLFIMAEKQDRAEIIQKKIEKLKK